MPRPLVRGLFVVYTYSTTTPFYLELETWLSQRSRYVTEITDCNGNKTVAGLDRTGTGAQESRPRGDGGDVQPDHHLRDSRRRRTGRRHYGHDGQGRRRRGRRLGDDRQ